ncbi:tripartite tricarboxylate transporter TctB family protein [Rhodoferax sp.]|uniref:tripartite tricarboxylate transporter TctB family protein n=1 Tax=Rhodoferax sp. TaxID=50421 RepID=UPI002620BA64|nr:tripartite tricarboxylate transporter TctB family protein [Rhodoferax sp.]MDD2919913.1 tripartite tricarboxylate transporter TctB family protein [Rhodoferax sp.]
MRQHAPATHSPFLQALVGIGVLLLALGLGVGALFIPSNAGYAGVGPNFLPWVVAIALGLCGIALVRKAIRGGFLHMEEHGGERPYWAGFAWMTAGMLLNAALITRIGFILSCALCFVLAARGLRNAQASTGSGLRSWLTDGVVALLIAAPVYWMFTKFLGINLPGLTESGWL